MPGDVLTLQMSGWNMYELSHHSAYRYLAVLVHVLTAMVDMISSKFLLFAWFLITLGNEMNSLKMANDLSKSILYFEC